MSELAGDMSGYLDLLNDPVTLVLADYPLDVLQTRAPRPARQ
jgi:hypothetical protein